ncbi:MAG: endolytic transglycosylase MltG [Phenylobacterium sp.]|uniref:endolytic transglycosylase MltG n=1 Tax=Phenylobacterium sp. TaxID=1871053 RepID=UPI00391BADFC
MSPARRLAIALGSAAATLAAVAALILGWALWSYYGPGPAARSGEATVVILRRGAGVTEIASTLERAGAIGSSAIFVAAAQLTGAGKSLKAGEYEVPSRASMARVLDDIRAGRVVRHQITVPEGMTSRAVVEALAAIPILTGVAPEPPEGTLLPETYQYQRGEDRAAVLKRMMDAQDELMATLWPARQPGLPFSTPEEALILASIVEKETGVAEERPRVAAVFVNRLRRSMRLDSDPTVIYGLTQGRPLGRGLRASELVAPSPYNTYQIAGLPPGPIANPGRAAIAAVLDPPETEDLFFVADGTGGHVFAPTYEEHQKNVARWRQIERERLEAAGAAPKTAAAKGGR